MTLPRLYAITDYWEKVPPMSICVAAIAYGLGMKRPESAKKDTASAEQLFAELGSGGTGIASGVPEWLKAARAAEATKK